MLVLFTLGLGMFIGAKAAGYVEKHYTPEVTATLNAQAGEVQKQIDALDAVEDKAMIEQLSEKKTQLTREALQAIEWRSIWMIPAIGAAVVLAGFVLIFKDGRGTEGQPSLDDVTEAAAREEQP